MQSGHAGGRYFVVKGRLWRSANPNLSDDVRHELVHKLMQARRDVGAALRLNNKADEADARKRVHAAKVALGERGPVWWPTDEGDYNQHLVMNSPYARWFGEVATR
ncbi:MAG: hypothetical protein EON93_03315 [Burkholderiales bacterium]|nr:MAG: hypothetical protein EON93_03315 [Burkholderiales bacterium]